MHDVSADEAAVRDLLELVATDQAPPSRVDVNLARRQGRRRRRMRRVYLPGAAPVAAAAAVAVIAAVTAGLSGSQVPARRPPATHRAPSALIAAPRRFSLFSPYASFGWVPAGFSWGAQYNQSASELGVTATAPVSDGRALLLMVFAARQCALTGRDMLTYLHTRYSFPHALSCGPPLSGRAPDVNGDPAYWSGLHGSLVWEYGKNAWAILSPTPNPAICVHCAAYPRLTGWYYVPAKNGHPAVPQSQAARRLLLKIAAAVRFGTSPPVHYGFTLSGLPASWRWRSFRAGDQSSFIVLHGRVVGVGWSTGPAVDPTALSVSVWPAGQGSVPCKAYAGQTSNVTVDGVRMLLRTIDLPGKHVQALCAQNFRGVAISVSLDLNVPGTNDRPLPGAAKVGGVFAVVRRLHLFGPNLADWPTQLP
jgi:hypothetical protein